MTDEELGTLFMDQGSFLCMEKVGRPRPLLSVRISSPDKEILERVQLFLGMGAISQITQRRWLWETRAARDCIVIVKRVVPYLRGAKKEDAEKVLWAAENVQVRRELSPAEKEAKVQKERELLEKRKDPAFQRAQERRAKGSLDEEVPDNITWEWLGDLFSRRGSLLIYNEGGWGSPRFAVGFASHFQSDMERMKRWAGCGQVTKIRKYSSQLGEFYFDWEWRCSSGSEMRMLLPNLIPHIKAPDRKAQAEKILAWAQTIKRSRPKESK
jgi:hypothetical protein